MCKGASHGSADAHAHLRVERNELRDEKHHSKAREETTLRTGTWDLVLVHCKESYNHRNVNYWHGEPGDSKKIPLTPVPKNHGERDGFSYVVEAASKDPKRLGFRRAFNYEKCGSQYNFGPNFTRVEGRHAETTTDFNHRGWVTPYELTYLQHILENYEDLPDWTVFMHGFPEDHNKHLIDWLSAFRRPRTPDAVYIPFGFTWVDRIINRVAQRKLKILDSMRVDGQEQDTVSCMTGAQFMVSKEAIRKHNMTFWKNLDNIFFKDKNVNAPTEGEPTIVDARVSTDAGEGTESLYGAIEIAWPIIFGRPPLDKKPGEQFYCHWFKEQKHSPCRGGEQSIGWQCYQKNSCPA